MSATSCSFLCVSIFAASGTATASLQEDLTWSLEVRPRYVSHVNGGGLASNRDFIARGVDNDNDYFFLRTTGTVTYKPTQLSWLLAHLAIRDMRMWDDERDPGPFEDEADLYEGYLQFGNLEEDGFAARIGRQELAYGSHLFVGVPDFNPGRSFDALGLQSKFGSWTVEGFIGRVVLREPEQYNDSLTEEFAYGFTADTQRIAGRFDLHLYLLSRNARESAPGGQVNVFTPGFWLRTSKGAWGPWDGSLEAAFQFGEAESGGTTRDLLSYIVEFKGGYTFLDAWGKPRFGVVASYSPGDSDPEDSKIETLDRFYSGKNRPRAGIVNLFSWRNTFYVGATANLQPASGLTLEGHYYLFWLADTSDGFYPQGGRGFRSGNGYGINPSYDSFAGSELSGGLKWKVNEWVDIHSELGAVFPGDYVEQSLRNTGGDTTAYYAQLTARLRL